MTATLVKAVAGVGAVNGPGDVVYWTPNEYKPAVWPVPLGAGKKPEIRRAVEEEIPTLAEHFAPNSRAGDHVERLAL